jgi:hypothetical protein
MNLSDGPRSIALIRCNCLAVRTCVVQLTAADWEASLPIFWNSLRHLLYLTYWPNIFLSATLLCNSNRRLFIDCSVTALYLSALIFHLFWPATSGRTPSNQLIPCLSCVPSFLIVFSLSLSRSVSRSRLIQPEVTTKQKTLRKLLFRRK